MDVAVAVAIAAHGEQLAEHGGAGTIRDRNMLESAMARLLNLVAYGNRVRPNSQQPMLLGSRATVRSSPVNERTAAVVSETFLTRNGYVLACDDVELVMTSLALAAGNLAVEGLAGWFHCWIQRIA